MRRHVGPENAISRGALVIELGLSDRTIRACLQQISEAGDVAIVHRSKAGGYYIANAARQVERELGQLRSRSASLQRRIRGLERAAAMLASPVGVRTWRPPTQIEIGGVRP
jgi:DNA-binding transcriptional regulator PaaX